MTVDEILATGQYTDRRGRCWQLGATGNWWHFPSGRGLTRAEVRLMIERDKHRDECVGLAECDSHPVLSVIWHRDYGHWLVFNESSFFPAGAPHESLNVAFSAARALAVGE